ncbi:MAG TPA: chlorinating enzyme [Terriglobales bacterium]|jgi:non-heme Fe2+,alpha-ketoglutarate-dependent halogenase|nr:chlorinating enzyme [Terriglobales bacterium]
MRESVQLVQTKIETEPLSADQLDKMAASFEKNGFIGPIQLYTPQEAREMLRQIRIDNLDRSHAIFDNDVNYDRHFDIPVLTRHIGHKRIIQILRRILSPDLLCWRTEFFPKFPGSAGTEWHQVVDYSYATGRPMLEPVLGERAGKLDITVWTAFTEATRENGCMKFLPGSHKHRYYDEKRSTAHGRTGQYRSGESNTSFFGYEFQDFKIDPNWFPNESEAAAMEMHAGECVMFTASCVHGSFPNTTQRQTRFAISSRYVPSHVRVYPDWAGFQAHGGTFDLGKYGCVQVSGTDSYGHNRVRHTNEWGEPFPYWGSEEE